MPSEYKYFFLSRSLDPSTVQDNIINSSSKKFELKFIEALNKKCNLEVIYVGKDKGKYNLSKINGEILYSCINQYSFVGFFQLLFKITNKKNIVITSGYYPFLTFILIISKVFGTSVYSLIYDTHKSAINNMNRMKMYLADLLFNCGFKFAKKFNGFFVLNSKFIKDLKIATPYLKISIGVEMEETSFSSINQENKLKRERKILCFAGTLNEDNGVEILLNAYQKDENLNFDIHFYGSGILESRIKERMLKDNRIKYFGRVSQETLKDAYNNADYLINLRNPTAISSSFAFPSKFIEYLSKDTPMISNIFPSLDEIYIPYIITVKKFNSDALIDCLSLIERKQMQSIDRSEIKKILEKNNSWDSIVNSVLLFTEERSK